MIPGKRLRACLRMLVLFLFLPGPLLGAEVDEAFLNGHPRVLEKLFNQLDPTHPQVGPIRRRWETGARVSAARQLSRYFAEKSFPLALLEPLPLPADPLRHAEAALENRFFLLDRWEQVPLLDGHLDWHHRGSRNDKERAWMLNRHAVFASLAETYRERGESPYRDRLNELWRDWILANPYPDRLTFSPPWRALEVARRILNSWVHIFYGYDVLDPPTRLLVLASVLDHGDALREHASFWGGNHLISEKLALLTLAVAWPEFATADNWRTYAADELSRQFLKQTYPDGSYHELSNHYQRVVLVNAQYFLRLLAHIDPAYRERPVIARIEAMWDFFAGVIRPDGSGPLNNASDLEENAFFLRKAAPFFDRPDWRYIASRGAEGQPPDGGPSLHFPWAGQAILRNGWDDKADWAYFDAGPYGTAHQHIDRFHLSASLGGRSLLVDTGRYTYLPGKWKNYFQGPEGHNILLLDESPSHQAPRKVRQPLPLLFEEDEFFAFAAARSAFPASRPAILPGRKSSVPWTRAVLLDKRGFVLVADHLVTFQTRELKALWHFHPEVDPGEAPRLIRLLSPQNALEPETLTGVEWPRIAGFYSPDYNLRLPAPQIRFQGRLRQPTSFLWILQDSRQSPIKAEIRSSPGAPVLSFALIQNKREIASGSIRLFPEAKLIFYHYGISAPE